MLSADSAVRLVQLTGTPTVACKSKTHLQTKNTIATQRHKQNKQTNTKKSTTGNQRYKSKTNKQEFKYKNTGDTQGKQKTKFQQRIKSTADQKTSTES